LPRSSTPSPGNGSSPDHLAAFDPRGYRTGIDVRHDNRSPAPSTANARRQCGVELLERVSRILFACEHVLEERTASKPAAPTIDNLIDPERIRISSQQNAPTAQAMTRKVPISRSLDCPGQVLRRRTGCRQFHDSTPPLPRSVDSRIDTSDRSALDCDQSRERMRVSCSQLAINRLAFLNSIATPKILDLHLATELRRNAINYVDRFCCRFSVQSSPLGFFHQPDDTLSSAP